MEPVVVIFAGLRASKDLRLPRLTGGEEADGIELGTVAMLGIGSARDVVIKRVVVDEGHRGSNRDRNRIRTDA